MNEKRPRIRSNLYYNVFFTIVNILYPVLLFSYVSRVVGPEIFGKLNFATALAAYFTLLGACAVAPYGSREIARAGRDDALVSKIVSELFSLNCISVMISVCLFLVLVFSVDKFQKDWLLFAITGVNIVSCGISPDWFFQGTENYRSIAIRNTFVKLATILCMFAFIKTRDDYLKYAAINAANTVAYFSIAMYICRKSVGIRFDLHGVRRHLRPLMFLTASLWMVSMYSFLDSVYLGFMADERSVGLYAVGMKINRMLITLIASMGVVLTPRISHYVERKMHLQYDEIIRRSFRLIVFCALPVGVLVFLLAPQIVSLIAGDKFRDAVLTLRIGTPLIPIVALGNWLVVCLMVPNRKDREIFLSAVCAVLVSIVANFLLVPLFKYNGTAAANVAAETTACIVLFIAFRKTTRRIHLADARLLNYIAAAAAGCVPVIAICAFVRSTAVSAVASVCCMGVVYIGGLHLRRDDIVADGLRMMRNGVLPVLARGMGRSGGRDQR